MVLVYRVSCLVQVFLAAVLLFVGIYALKTGVMPFMLLGLVPIWFGLRAAKMALLILTGRFRVTFPPLFRRN